jgi:hypothetical protein
VNSYIQRAVERSGTPCTVAVSGVLTLEPDLDRKIWKRDWILTVYQQG